MGRQTNTIAVVNIQKAVAVSEQVKALKNEQLAKTQELQAWLKNAQDEIKNETDKEKQAALLQRYNAEFAQRKNEMVAHYQKELKIVSDSISQTIAEEAQAKGYKLVLDKKNVIFGGLDITADIAKIIK